MAIVVRHLRKVAPYIILPDHYWDPTTSFINSGDGSGTITDTGLQADSDVSKITRDPPLVDATSTASQKAFEIAMPNANPQIFRTFNTGITNDVGFTFSTWIAPEARGVVIANVFANIRSGQEQNGFKLFARESNNSLGVEMGNGTTGQKVYGPSIPFQTGTVANFTMYHAAWRLSRSKGTIDMWVDGVKGPTQTLPADVPIDPSTYGYYQIGAAASDSMNRMFGLLGAHALWDKPVNDASIVEDFERTRVLYNK